MCMRVMVRVAVSLCKVWEKEAVCLAWLLALWMACLFTLLAWHDIRPVVMMYSIVCVCVCVCVCV